MFHVNLDDQEFCSLLLCNYLLDLCIQNVDTGNEANPSPNMVGVESIHLHSSQCCPRNLGVGVPWGQQMCLWGRYCGGRE